jgi:(p)ppGpp synthase/HD superfamily hydrolase
MQEYVAATRHYLKRAVLFALKAHDGDYWGEQPYAAHLYMVADEARELEPDNMALQAAAWLHDVIEDHPELSDQVKKEFPEIYESILAVSRREGESYDEFIDRILATYDPFVIRLKYCDMMVNLYNNPKQSLRERYERNIKKLEKAVINSFQ